MTKEYLIKKIETARAAIAYAVPGADLSYAKAILTFAELKLAKMAGSTCPPSPFRRGWSGCTGTSRPQPPV